MLDNIIDSQLRKLSRCSVWHGRLSGKRKIYLRVQGAYLAEILYRIVILRATEMNNDRSQMLFEGWCSSCSCLKAPRSSSVRVKYYELLHD